MAAIYDVMNRWADYNEGKLAGTNKKSVLSSSSVRCDGPILYSYRMPIARYYENMVLVQAGQLRITTTKHRRWAMQHVSGYYGDGLDDWPIFMVEDINGDHGKNLRALVKEMLNAVATYERRYLVREGCSTYDSMHHQIMTEYSYCLRYRERAGLHGHEVPDVEVLIAAADRIRDEKWAKYMDPKAVAQRERKQARKEMKEALLGEDRYY